MFRASSLPSSGAQQQHCYCKEKLSQGKKKLSQGKKKLSQGKKKHNQVKTKQSLRKKLESEIHALLYRVADFRRNPVSTFRVEENPSIEIYIVDHNRDKFR
jgi:CxxC motif-containing protein